MNTPLAAIARRSLALLALAALPAVAQTPDPRVRMTINDGWRYRADGVEFAEKGWLNDTGWERVNLPHTWNAQDVFDDVESYRRGIGWYRKRLTLPDSLKGKRVFLHFEGANQTAEVYVNGAYAGEHAGGYTAFTLDVTRHLQWGGGNEQLIAVQVDNSHRPAIAPLSVGFALYGGIYRDVWLVATDSAHVTLGDHGGPGVYVTTPRVSREAGEARVRGTLSNDGGAARTLRVVSTILDSAGARVGEATTTVRVPARGQAEFAQALPAVRAPRLWSPDTPYLYSVRTDVHDGDRVIDRVTSPLGFRWFRFDADSGFTLNGRKTFLRGTNRHQDYQGLGSALSNQLHVRDLEIIKAMGANFLRLAHYPQDPAVLDAADRLGLLIWEEVPVVNQITVSDAFTANSQRMLREMIRQHHNHPSVVIWGTMNEVFLWSEAGARIARQSDTTYMRQVRDFARGMERLARAEDPARATAMAIHGAASYDTAGVAEIPMVLGLNLYNGWYGGTFAEYGPTLDRRHVRSPKQAILLSEYGSGSELRLNSTAPERFDHSGTWHRMYHESYIRQSRARPWLAGTAVWNQFDFSQPHIGETTPHMNKKGLYTFDRKPKDVYYLYQANWTTAPMVYVASRDWSHRGGVGATTVTQPIDVYTTLGSVELFVNGKSLGAKTPDDVRKASWDVAFADGDNVVEARATGEGQTAVDRMTIRMDRTPADLRDPKTPFRELAVNVGSNAQYADADGLVWLADQPYAAGSFGSVGGQRALMAREVVITNTAQSPMYATYQSNLQGYRVDVPDGDYEVELRFAGTGGVAGTAAAGGAEAASGGSGARVFSVAVNGATVAERLDLTTRGNVAPATTLTVTTSATNGGGIVVAFRALQGQPVLNGIRVRRR
ncbi:glycoside hydrolase family 2 TIM barrel-domain containing protein [Roseisolibacter agri]|uniref:Beta-galactosidase n=1 Tax=Roseisolibacter agri TaxID=2014610 RepID=A0AA37PZH6_9BACT|nr:glycoside hydrolase family 2 TIM barrel-domain containing protein [Roseisolibacter agri]GLC23644.1 beta-galactosidase [Roseisolibacter agri]